MDEFEDYDVTSIIGSGSFGTCFKVKHKVTMKEYVWKAVNYGRMTEEKKQSLVSEVNVLSKLRHPNIVRYFDHIIHTKSSILYIIMEYCSGGDLSKIIDRCLQTSQCLDETFIWRVLYQIALALNVCHSQCVATVLHRDIKPANVFLDAENNVKLGDFGLAKILNDKENFTETVVGTPLYMSPELIKNKKYNKKSDIWALGCLIYEVAALKPPFNGNSLKNLSSKIKEGKFNRIPGIYSDDLQKMIDFMLNTEFENRPTVDIIIRHPTVLLKSSKSIKSIYKISPAKPEEIQFEIKINENLQMRIDNIRNREAALKIREEKLNDRERCLNKREKKIIIMERLTNEKIARANLYLKRSKENKYNDSTQCTSSSKVKQFVNDLDDTSYSADPGDNSILPTSGKINEEHIVRPKGFVRSKSERRVHFNAQKVFQSTAEDPVVFKEYNFFNDENVDPKSVPETKSKKKNYFGIGVFKSTLNSKVSQSNSSLGSKTSSNSSEVLKPVRPISWTEENKKCAFSLLKIINTDCDKENIHSKMTHTKL